MASWQRGASGGQRGPASQLAENAIDFSAVGDTPWLPGGCSDWQGAFIRRDPPPPRRPLIDRIENFARDSAPPAGTFTRLLDYSSGRDSDARRNSAKRSSPGGRSGVACLTRTSRDRVAWKNYNAGIGFDPRRVPPESSAGSTTPEEKEGNRRRLSDRNGIAAFFERNARVRESCSAVGTVPGTICSTLMICS